MAPKADGKFGTFGGVFTPSILTILGVIMYLRLPWVVGQAGLIEVAAIIVAAHVVTICTGLSISSIATDKSVGAGGPYYIVSRSLGLPIGGTLGIALFVGLCFSIALYIIGFSESFLANVGLEITPTAIRVTGMLTMIALTVITFISTSFAIKTQYVIMALIALSLLSIFFGSPATPSTEILWNKPEGEGIAEMPVLFAIFFPAVTGLTAGVNMSGDLRDAKRAIPLGTMAAVLTGMAIYLALAIFLAVRVPQAELMNPRVLEDMALFAPAVTAGIWGATLSSALGSILGAPRILQSVSADGITPRWFARGYGPTNEPRNALALAFAIGAAGVLIAELDLIARVVSMIFMATYGFLNTAAAIEAFVSPDFRPDFKIPKTVSVVGAVAAGLLMIQMDLAAMAGATVLMAGLYVYLQRRQLQLESGDAWEGVWSALVRAGLHRLASGDRQHRNWQPNILLFRPDDGATRDALRRCAAALVTGSGMLTDVLLGPRKARGRRADDDAAESGPSLGVFHKRVATADPYASIELIAQHHGYAGVEPNTVLCDWDACFEDPSRFGPLLDHLHELDLNTLLFSDATHNPPAGTAPRIDVWWREDGTPSLGIALCRFLTASPAYRTAKLRFRTVSNDAALADRHRNTARRMLEEARVAADVDVIFESVETRSFEAHVAERSADALLAIVELPPPPVAPHLEALGGLTPVIPSVLFVGPSSMFRQRGRVSRAPLRPSKVPEATAGDEAAAGDETSRARDEGLAALGPEGPARASAEAHLARLEATIAELFEQCLRPAAAPNAELVAATQALVDKHFGLLEDGVVEPNPVKRRRAINRVQSAFVIECRKLLDGFVAEHLPAQRDVLEDRLGALLDGATYVTGDGPVTVSAAAPAEGAARAAPHAIDVAPLQRFHGDRAIGAVLDDTLRSFVTGAFGLAVTLGRVVNGSRTSLTLLHAEPDADPTALAAFVRDERQKARERLEEIARGASGALADLHEAARARARTLAEAYADDLRAADVAARVDARRRASREADPHRAEVRAWPAVFFEDQAALFERTRIGLSVSGFQHRVATIAQRTEEAIALEIKNGVLHAMVELERELEGALEAETDPPKLELRVSHRFDPEAAITALARDAQRSADELPEEASTVSDDSIQRLAEGEDTTVERVDLPLRRLGRFLVEAELVGPLTELLDTVPPIEDRAVAVAADVTRLLAFHQKEAKEGVATESPASLRALLDSGLVRIRAERERLAALLPTLRSIVDARLEAIVRGTDVYELTRSAKGLTQHLRRRQGQRAVSGAHSLLMDGVARVRQALIRVVYAESAGVVLARRLSRERERGTRADRLAAFVEEQGPSASALSGLPFYYRQLFLGKSALDETYWVGREAEIAAARRAIARHARGVSGALFVTGEPDSGKTALARRITSRVLAGARVVWVAPPEDGSADPAVFAERLRDAAGARGDVSEVLAALPERSVVVIEDLELFFERTPSGLAAVDTILAAIEEHGRRLLFVVEIGATAFALLDRLRGLADRALAVLECGPLSAELIKEMVMLRHGSTGVTFELDGVAEPELGELRLARLFARHFTFARGLPGPALASWITHVDRADDRSMQIRAPSRRAVEALEGLRPPWLAVLVCLLVHKRMTRARVGRVAGLEGAALDAPLDALERSGLVHRTPHGILVLDRYAAPAVIERLAAEGVLP